MEDTIGPEIPGVYEAIVNESREIGFTMSSDPYVGSLLKTLVASKPNGRFLELGTGTGLSQSWMIGGMGAGSSLTSIENDPELIRVAWRYFGEDPRVRIVLADARYWIRENRESKYDLIFADTWPGKYSQLDEVLAMVAPGGFYVTDDMNRQSNWPEGHREKAQYLQTCLEQRKDFNCTMLNWSTGIIIAVRIERNINQNIPKGESLAANNEYGK